MDQPPAGIRVLSMEQAAALPFTMRHLADLGAEVIRVEAHTRFRGAALSEIDLARNKKRWGLDLSAEGRPAGSRRTGATPRASRPREED